MPQDKLMAYDPATGLNRPYPSHASQYREWHGKTAWLFNPWTGQKRDARDVGSDVYGYLIHDGGPMVAAAGGVLGGSIQGALGSGPTIATPRNRADERHRYVNEQSGQQQRQL